MIRNSFKQLALGFLVTALLPVGLPVHAQSQSLADRHETRSISCEGCHITKGKPEIKKDTKGREACVSCHGYYPEMIKRTEKTGEEVNPHDQHDGDLPCTECHKGHKPGVNYCEECHGTFVFEVP